MDFLNEIVGKINTYLTDYVLLFLLVGIGLFFTIRTRFVQVRCFGEGMKQVFGNIKLKGGKNGGGLSSFQALATAIAAQVGTGNIVGACGAILIGGPGAIFWMWIIAFFGMATIYSEAVLAQKTRVTNEDGTVEGGPVHYIRTAFTGKFGKFLAGFFAVAAIIALGFVGAMVQSNSIAENVAGAVSAFGAEGTALTVVKIVIGVLVAALAGIVLIGGTDRLASVTEKIVPIMACLYLLGGLVVLGIRIQYVPAAFGMIFKYAFMPQAITGGAIGFAIKTALTQGAKRGLFSNEAGMGSTPHAHALANVKNPHDQGITAMIGVFIDTFVVLTMTALIVICTLFAKDGALGKMIATNEMLGNSLVLKDMAGAAGISGGNMAQKAFAMAFGGSDAANVIGSVFVALCLFFFAFSTILSWNYFGKVNFMHLFGKNTSRVYAAIAIVFVFLGSIFSNDLVWSLTDMFNNLMVLPNVIALAALSGLVVAEVRAAAERKKNSLPADAKTPVNEEE
ncbi:MAG: sodium:alanine symporter family protein [Clostridia bacterium]|nr:sodium:alanine symporter family protein [Clostridia bacterium]